MSYLLFRKNFWKYIYFTLNSVDQAENNLNQCIVMFLEKFYLCIVSIEYMKFDFSIWNWILIFVLDNNLSVDFFWTIVVTFSSSAVFRTIMSHLWLWLTICLFLHVSAQDVFLPSANPFSVVSFRSFCFYLICTIFPGNLVLFFHWPKYFIRINFIWFIWIIMRSYNMAFCFYSSRFSQNMNSIYQ